MCIYTPRSSYKGDQHLTSADQQGEYCGCIQTIIILSHLVLQVTQGEEKGE